MASPLEIFCCYARKDQQLLNDLKAHLMPLQRQGLIILWADTDIGAGTEWEKEIEKHLNTAQIILLLVSRDFMNSDYCYSKEMQWAIERHKRGEARVLPIIIRPVYWEGTPFGKLQALPTDAKAVTSRHWHNRDEAFLNVTKGIRKVVENLHIKLADNSVEASEKSDKELSAQPTISPLITPIKFKEEEIIIPTLKSEHPTPIDTSTILLNSQKSTPISPNQLLSQSTDATPPTAIPLIVSSKDTDQPAISDDIASQKMIEDTPQLESATFVQAITLGSPFVLPRITFLQTRKQAPTEETIKNTPLTNPETFTFKGTFGEISWPTCCVAISPDGETIASVSIEGKNTEFKLWNFYTGGVKYFYDKKGSLITARGFYDWLDGWLESSNQMNYSFWEPRSQSNLFNLYGKYGFRSVVAISPNGETLVSGNEDFTIKTWNFQDRNLLDIFRGHSKQVNSLAISPNGKTLISGSEDSTIKLWNMDNGKLLFTLAGHSDAVESVAITSDGQTLVSMGKDSTIMVWNLRQGNLSKSLERHAGSVYSVAISPDGQWLASGSEDTTIKLWSLPDGKLNHSLSGHTGPVYSIAISPDGKWLVSGSEDTTIKLWSLHDGRLLRNLVRHTGPVYSVAMSPDGKWFASGSSDKTIKIWGSENTQQQQTATLFSVTILERTIALPRITFLHDRQNVQTPETLNLGPLPDHESFSFKGALGGISWPVCGVAVSPDGTTLASVSIESENFELKLWDLQTRKVQYSHTNTRKGWETSSGATGGIFNWLTLTSQGLDYEFRGLSSTQSSFESLRYYGLRNVVAISPDGEILASASEDTTIKLWNFHTWKLLFTLKEHTQPVECVAITPDGQTLVSLGKDSAIMLWNLHSGKLQHKLERHAGSVYSIAISPDGQWLAGGSEDTTIKLWNLHNGKVNSTLTGHAGSVYSIAFSPDGQWLASGSEDATIKLWNPYNGKLLDNLEKHAAAVYSVAISPDGQALVSGSSDTTIKVWKRK
jgi:WD40 repeat protein